MNRYKYHHTILTFLKVKFDEFDKDGEYSKYSFSSFDIAKNFKISEVVSERILFELKEYNCVDFKKSIGFKISENGIKKQLTGFFKYKNSDHRLSLFKERLAVAVSFIAIITFFLSLYIKSKDKCMQQETLKELKLLKSNNK